MMMKRLAVTAEGNLANAAVILRICSVHVARKSASEKAMIESGVELDPAFLAASAYLNAAELLGPLLSGQLMGLVEVKLFSLSKIVKPCILDRGIGKTKFHLNLLPFHGIVIQYQNGSRSGNLIPGLNLRAIILESAG